MLVWGLIVALARLMPGKAGQPIRALAILYCDIFRGLPAVVTLYLIGFGIPTSGLPDLIVPHIVGLFVDMSSMRSSCRLPLKSWATVYSFCDTILQTAFSPSMLLISWN